MSRYTPPLGEWGEYHFEYLKVFLGEADVLYTPILVIKVPKPLFQPLFRAQLAGEQTKAARMSPSMVERSTPSILAPYIPRSFITASTPTPRGSGSGRGK